MSQIARALSPVSTRIWVVIPAAGAGRRMQSPLPKQYLPLYQHCVLDYSVAPFLVLPGVEQIVIALAADDAQWAEQSLAQHPKIETVIGGDARFQSVLNALHTLAPRATDQDWVLVHDAARPCVRLADVSRLLAVLSNHPVGGLLGVPVRDTLKQVQSETFFFDSSVFESTSRESAGLESAGDVQVVTKTLAREGVWHALTPQLFRFGVLYPALQQVARLGVAVTDESEAIERFGLAPQMVAGAVDNIKITHPDDLALAAFLLKDTRLTALEIAV